MNPVDSEGREDHPLLHRRVRDIASRGEGELTEVVHERHGGRLHPHRLHPARERHRLVDRRRQHRARLMRQRLAVLAYVIAVTALVVTLAIAGTPDH